MYTRFICAADPNGSRAHIQEANSPCPIDVKEIRVQHGLQDARKDGNGVEAALGEVAEEPVGDVQGAIDAERE